MPLANWLALRFAPPALGVWKETMSYNSISSTPMPGIAASPSLRAPSNWVLPAPLRPRNAWIPKRLGGMEKAPVI